MKIPRFGTIIGLISGPAIIASGLARRPRSGGGMKRAVRPAFRVIPGCWRYGIGEVAGQEADPRCKP
jgi:hypothetical protein